MNGQWTLQFNHGGPTLPPAAQLTQLGSWTDLPGDAIKKFSGTATYSTHIAKPSGTTDAFLLELGKVEKSAEVWLNGKQIATVIGPVYRVVIPADQFTADNVLEIKVSNGMANRIIDMERRNVEWKKFYNVNFPARLAANREDNGLFSAARWQPEASGLLGPVTITPVTLMK